MTAAITSIPKTSIGNPLRDTDLADLAARWIDRISAEMADLRWVDHFTGKDLINGRRGANCEGISIPYFLPGSSSVIAYRLRRFNPEIDLRTGKPCAKYLSAPNERNHVYFPRLTTPENLDDSSLSVLIVEGELKAIAMRRLAYWQVSLPRFLSIGLSGVWNWRGTVGATTNESGTRVPIKGVIPDLERIAWPNRRAIIAFDADSGKNPSVAAARYAFSVWLREQGAEVGYLEWKIEHGKGPDDWVAKVGPDEVLAAIARVQFNTATGWQARLLCTHTGKPKALLSNAMLALHQDSQFEGVLRFNEFARRTEIGNEPPWERQARARKIWTDDDDRHACAWLQEHHIEVSIFVAAEAVQSVAMQNDFHPVRDFLEGLVWDGEDRVDSWLMRYLGVPSSNYSSAVGRRWLISAIARIMQPGCKVDCCLILEGLQGSGKSTAMRILGGDWFTDEIAELGSPNASLQTRGVWLIELSELDSLSKSETSRIKAFMSRTTDRFRPPYGRRLIESPRQCIFVGTINHSAYLRDETGARRFWPVKCHSIDLKALEQDRDQLFAEAVVLYRNGCPWWLDTSDLTEAAADEQQSRYEGDAWDEPIRRWAANQPDTSVDEILTSCLGKDRGLWSQSDQNRVARSLTSQGWRRYRAGSGNVRSWRYRRADDE